MNMKIRKHPFILSMLLLGSLLLSACAGLLEQVEQAVQEDYGPNYSAQERHTRSFEALWTLLEKNYIHYDSAGVDWDSLHDQYTTKIEAGLDNDQFSDLLRELGAELPIGALAYQSRSERLEADTGDFSTYEGIGAIIGFQEKEEPHIVILDVIEDSPAEKAGLKPHDSIYAIDGNPVLLEEGLSVVNRVRGPAGSTVTLDVRSPGKAERTVEVTRGKLASGGKLEAYQIKGTQYGYILFPPINYADMTNDVRASLQTFTSNQKMEGLILDLRVASSSNGWPLGDLFALFFDGNAGEFYNRADQTEAVAIKGEDYLSSQSVPLIILIGSNTTGSPEILAASLQAGDRAIIIGGATSGSIEATDVFYLPDGSRIFIETASFRLSDGSELGGKGIKPDVALDAGWDKVHPNSDPVLDKAVEILDEQK